VGETIGEYIARGGKLPKLPPSPDELILKELKGITKLLQAILDKTGV
jgi:hypothetical protein